MMRQFKNNLLMSVVIGVVASSGAASAADLPRRAPAPPVSAVSYIAPMFTWTGFYVGANIGYGWGDGDGRIAIAGVGAGPISGDGNGVLGGLQAGYNWQSGSLVFGVETDIQASGGEGDVTGSPGTARLTAQAETPWFGTLRGRVGFAHDRWLFYVTGGGVYGNAKLSGTVSGPGGGSFSSSESYWAWTLGGGVEAALWDRWSAKLEYLHIGSPSDTPSPPGTRALTGDTSSHIVRVGLNYHF